MFALAAVENGAGEVVIPEIVMVVEPVFVRLTRRDVPWPTASLPKFRLDELAINAPKLDEAEELFAFDVELPEFARFTEELLVVEPVQPIKQ